MTIFDLIQGLPEKVYLTLIVNRFESDLSSSHYFDVYSSYSGYAHEFAALRNFYAYSLDIPLCDGRIKYLHISGFNLTIILFLD